MAIEYRFKLRRRTSSSADPTDLLHGEMASVEPTGGFWYGWGAGSGDLADENRLLFCSDGTRLWHDVVGASDGTTEFVGDGSGLTGVVAASVDWSGITGTPTTLSGYGITDGVDTGDARLTNAREWTASTVSQAEAETGTATTRRAWTAQRVRQAIVAWWSGSSDKSKLDGIAVGANNYTHPNHSGDVTSVGDGVTTIANSAVSNAKLANMASGTIKGRVAVGTGNAQDLTATQVRTLLNVADGATVGATWGANLASIPAAIDAIDGLTPAANRLAYYTGASTAALATLTAAGRALLDDADAAAQRTTLGLGNVDNTADASKVVASAAVWTTARTLTVGDSGKSVDGSGNVAWTLAEIGAVPDEILYGPMAVGGSANAITLTTGAGLSAIPRNLTLWFRATSANSGDTTINLDGIGAVACRTVTGAVLPSGYIRTDVQTPFWYDGTNIIVGRLPEIVTTGSVRAVKQADGNMVCETIIDMTADAWTTATGAFFVSASGGASVTFGVTFAAAPALQCTIQRGSATQICGCWASNVTTSGAAIRPFSNSSIAGGVTKTIHVTATGRWY